jgi:multidrug efflux system outer membrane protein
MTVRTLVLSLLLPFVVSCASLPPVESQPQVDNLPRQFSVDTGSIDLTTGWWKDFGSDELNSLMTEAMNTNFSVREAYARLSQAHFAALEAGAALWPTLSASGGAGFTDGRSTNGPAFEGDDWSLGLSASYEVDLWGRVRAGKESEALLAGASAEDVKTALISISGQIAENWISLISNRRQQQLFERQLELQRNLLQLITNRFPLGKSTALDIYQQQEAIERIKEALIPLRSEEKSIERQLAFLLGRASIDADRLQTDRFPALPDIPGVGLPAELLGRRPDIRAAGLRIAAGRRDISAATADLLPALRLTASHSYGSDDLGSLFDNWVSNLAANLVAPLLDGKRRLNEVERVRAIVEERLAVYGRTVFAAIREVEDALAEEKQFGDSMESLNRQLELSDLTIREARRRYLNGNSDFLNVLREELNVMQVEQDLITAEEQMLSARIRLYRALGGSWMDRYVKEYSERRQG